MQINRSLFRTGLMTMVIITFGIVAHSLAQAEDEMKKTSGSALPSFTPKGADTCLKCHDEDSEYPVLPIFKTPHARKGDARTPFADRQCESCHGPGGDHAARIRPGQERPPMPAFGKHSQASINEQNGQCQTCHETHRRIGWEGSPHETSDMLCSSCHSVHKSHDPVLNTVTQPEVCFDCHTQVRGQTMQLSAHPIRQGQMACTDCHEVHSNFPTDGLLQRPTLNETCYSCHAEKRGPFLWEHAPATEDCSTCHQPHGSMHSSLLSQTKPLLCQNCHSQMDHPSTAYTSEGLAGGKPNAFLLMNSCTNCHSQVHGSNHPSGVKLMR